MTALATFIAAFLAIWLIINIPRHPGFAIGLYISFYPLEQLVQYSLPFLRSFPAALNYVLALACGISLVSIATRRKTLITRSGATTLNLSLLLLIFASFVNSLDRDTSLSIVSYYYRSFILGFLAFSVILKSKDALYDAYRSTIWLSPPILLGLATVPIRFRSISLGATPEGFELANPLAVATYAGLIIIAALTNVIHTRRSTASTIASAVAILLATYITIKSGTRGQLVAAIVTTITISLLTRARRLDKRFILPAAAGLLAFAAFLLVFQAGLSSNEEADRLAYQWSGGLSRLGREYSLTRVNMATRLLEEWAHEISSQPTVFLFGLGVGYSFSKESLGFYCHVVPVEVLCEYGMLAFVVYTAIVVSTGLAIRRIISRTSPAVGINSALFFFCSYGLYLFILSFKQGSFLGYGDLMGLSISLTGLASATRASAEGFYQPCQYQPCQMEPCIAPNR